MSVPGLPVLGKVIKFKIKVIKSGILKKGLCPKKSGKMKLFCLILFCLFIQKSRGDCPPGAFLFPLADTWCYKFMEEQTAFTEAEVACSKYPNGHLASVSNSFVNDLLAGEFDTIS